MISATVKLRSRGGGTKVVVLRAWVGGGGGILSDMTVPTVWAVVEPVQGLPKEIDILIVGAPSWAQLIPMQRTEAMDGFRMESRNHGLPVRIIWFHYCICIKGR